MYETESGSMHVNSSFDNQQLSWQLVVSTWLKIVNFFANKYLKTIYFLIKKGIANTVVKAISRHQNDGAL